MKKIYLLLFCTCFLPALLAADNFPASVRLAEETVEKNGDSIRIGFTMNIDSTVLHPQRMLSVTPLWITEEGDTVHRLAPVVVAGKRRWTALERERFYDGRVFEPEPYAMIRWGKRDSVSVAVEIDGVYEKWMSGSRIVMYETLAGCVDCELMIEPPYAFLGIPVYKEPKVYRFQISYIIPEAEPVKRREETFSAHLNYEVNRYNLLRDYKNNAQILGQVAEIITELQDDPNLTITEFKVTGYASPEGNFNSNQTLSENRANAFLDYLRTKYGFDTRIIQAEGKGEDWDGLRELVAGLDIPEREQVLDIIDHTEDIARRKSRLMALSGGSTYRNLLTNYYPRLRRNDYTVAYEIKAFDIDEAREVIKTNPSLLNLNEMYLLAESYPKDSPEFKEVFDIAARLYPDQDLVKVNAAALEIENGAFEAGMARMRGIDLPAAWNNAGVVYARSGEMERAVELFRKAALAGNPEAVLNLEQFEEEE